VVDPAVLVFGFILGLYALIALGAVLWYQYKQRRLKKAEEFRRWEEERRRERAASHTARRANAIIKRDYHLAGNKPVPHGKNVVSRTPAHEPRRDGGDDFPLAEMVAITAAISSTDSGASSGSSDSFSGGGGSFDGGGSSGSFDD
jgi:uncharacterized membrane protein YgcG